MPLMQGKSDKAFTKNVKTEMDAHPGRTKQNLAVAYAIKRRNMKAKGGEMCPDCMSAGGKCMAHGGLVDESRERDAHAGMAGDRDQDLEMVPMAEGTSGSPTEDAAVRGTHEMSPAEMIMEKRRNAQGIDHEGRKRDPGIDIHLSKGGYVDSSEDDIAPIHDFSELPDDEDDSTTGEMHDADHADEAQEESLVGQIMQKRRLKKI